MLSLLKRIIRAVCPKTNSLVTRGDKIIQNVYALDMNILSEEEIAYLLQICQLKYPAAYPDAFAYILVDNAHITLHLSYASKERSSIN